MSAIKRKKQAALNSLAGAASAVAATLFGATAAQAGSTTQPSAGVTTTYNGPATVTPYPSAYDGPVPGNSNGGDYTTISLSGSTAMRGYTTGSGITYLPPQTDIFLSSGSYFGTDAGGASYQLAPTDDNSAPSGSTPNVPALEVQWHEQGSVEGILELVTDQIGTPSTEPLSLSDVSRSPTATNPVWVNGNKFGGTGNINGWEVDAFSNPAAPGTQPQSPVQMAIADVKPIQGFAYTTTLPNVSAPAPNTPAFELQPGQAGYGMGNPNLVQAANSNIGALGVAGSNEQLVNQSSLNMTQQMTDPATGKAYAAGPWNSGGINNLQTNTVAITATDFAANPGTGMVGVNKTDAQWLQLTGRLANGATFNMSTRDTNSGTRNTAANNTGIDPSWAVGVNDDGNTLATGSTPAAIATSTEAADLQNSIDVDANGQPAMRFSGKTAGGFVSQTVANNRMAIGTLSLPDSLKVNNAATATPVRVLAYNPGADTNPANYIYPDAQSITDGSYAIWQQEQYVTVKSPNTSYATASAATWAVTSDLQTGIKGDVADTSVPLDANITVGSNVISGGNVTDGGFVVGQVISSAAFPAGTQVTGITFVDNGNSNNGTVASVTLSNAAIATAGVPRGSGTISDLTVTGGDVANFRANILNAQTIAATNAGFATAQDPGDALISAGFILPQFMQVQKSVDGGPVTSNTLAAFNINTNPTGYNSTAAGFFLGSADDANLAKNFTPFEALSNSSTPKSGDVNETDATQLTVPTASAGGYYGESVRSATTINGTTLVPAQAAVDFTNGDIAINGSNYLFGNFNNNGIRDYSSFMTGVDALKALYNSGLGVDVNTSADVNGTTGSDALAVPNANFDAADPGLSAILGSNTGSTFMGQRGSSGAGASQASSLPNASALGASKGDLIVMGDYNGDGVFDGKDIYAMAIGATLSENYSTTHLNSMKDISTGVLNKNGALNYVQTNTADATYDSNGNATDASAFLRQSARAILTAPALPQGATQLYRTTDANGNPAVAFTYDPTGANAFNAQDVNRDGVVDLNDAVDVDQFNGQSYGSQADQVAATIQTPVTGTTEPVSLVVVQQIDNESQIGSADLAAINSGLTGAGNANWYGYNLQKTGPGTITWARTGGTVTVNPGASYEVSAGVMQISGSLDPFSDNNASGTTVGNHVALTVDQGAKVQYTQAGLTSTVSSLSIDTGSGAALDVGPSTLAIDYTPGNDPANVIRGYLQSGYNNDKWNGPGINSTTAQANTGLYAVGYADGNTDHGTPAAANQILIKTTVAGDANLDGLVNFSDLLLVAQDYGRTGQDWADADFNYDGLVNFSDLLLVAQNYGKQLSAGQLAELPGSFAAQWQLAEAEVNAAAPSSVPEPATTSLMVIAAGGLLARRRRKRPA